MNRYFDIALNLASERFSGERDKVIADALTRNVNYFNIVCSSLNELDFVKDLNDRYKQNSCFTLGVHPHNANELNGNTLNSLKDSIKTHQPSAVGETGLDFFRNLSSYENQINAFEQQIIISIENKEIGKVLINNSKPFALIKIKEKEFEFDKELNCENAKVLFKKPQWLSII